MVVASAKFRVNSPLANDDVLRVISAAGASCAVTCSALMLNGSTIVFQSPSLYSVRPSRVTV